MNLRDILGMSNFRHLRLIELLYASPTGLPSDQLLEELKCVPSVLLKDIRVINSQEGAFKILKYKGLYQLQIKPHVSINRLYAYTIRQTPEFQIIEELLYEECGNIDDLSRKIFISPTKTQRNLKKIESVLLKAGIMLRYRPLRLEGKESVIRHLYYRFFIEKSDGLNPLYLDLKEFQVESITNLVNQFIEDNLLDSSYISRRRLGYTIYISLWRIKNQHYYPKKELRSHLKLPEKQTLDSFKQMALEAFRMSISSENIKDCLWLFYSDSVVISETQLLNTLNKRRKYADEYYIHLKLVEEFNYLLNFSLGIDEKRALTVVLMNEHGLYPSDGKFINILFLQRKIYLEKLSETHFQLVEKVKRIVIDFVNCHKIYQEEDFVWNYVYMLITMVPQSLTLLASCNRPLKILLLSDLPPMAELFLGNQIESQIHGNFEVLFGEEKLTSANISRADLEKYDALISTGSVDRVPEYFPTVVIDPSLMNQDIVRLQQLISELSNRRRTHSN